MGSFISTLPDPVFWLWLSGITFLAMAIILLFGPLRKEKSELMYAFFGFLAGMACFHIFLGAGMYYDNLFLTYIGVLGALTGSAFVLKFPLTEILNKSLRNYLFYIALGIGCLLVLLMILNSYGHEKAMFIASVYMIVVSGAIGGFYIVWKGLHLKEPAMKIKCVGGGCSIVFCCLITHLIVITIGMTLLAKFFMVLTPIVLIFAVYLSRAVEQRGGQGVKA